MSKANKRERQRLNREQRRQYQEQLDRRRKRLRALKGFAIIAVPVLAVGVVLSASSGGDAKKAGGPIDRTFDAPPKMTIDPESAYTATIETSEGTIVVELDAKAAPTSVNNFVFLARKRFYDGLRISRVAKDFVIQTGSPDNTQQGGPGYTVQAELPTAPYEIGAVAWAKAGTEAPGTAGSQFFIATGAGISTLPLEYGIIGKVTSGLDVAQAIGALFPESEDGPPTKRVTIRKVTITAFASTVTTTTTTPPGSTTTSSSTPSTTSTSTPTTTSTT